MKISMCSSAEPNESSMAERLNRTLKEDFNVKGFISFCEASQVIEQVVKTYNDYRPHASLDYKTPKQARQSIGSQRLRWYPYKKIRFSNVIRKPVNSG
ncbi:integrase core domain-containing protein [Emticicia sp. SJ17W-69]|uniref:integrase core domain-containing protein n=1 Tax=Emticicia sp. SJ17W-69 TaxID=3421657 RepID=UPI003EBA88FF